MSKHLASERDTDVSYEKIKEYTEEVKASLTEKMKEIRAYTAGVFSEISQKLFDDLPGLQIVFIEGTTPYFNDGEACEHSSEAHVYTSETRWFEAYNMKQYKAFPDGQDSDSLETYHRKRTGQESYDDKPFVNDEAINKFLDEEMINQITEAEAAVVENFFNDSCIDDFLEQSYGTNWALEIRRDLDGKVEVRHHEIEPAY